MLLSSTTVNGAVSNDSNNNITMSVGNTVIANVNSSGIFFESGKKAIYTGAVLQVVSNHFNNYQNQSQKANKILCGSQFNSVTNMHRINFLEQSLYSRLNRKTSNHTLKDESTFVPYFFYFPAFSSGTK